MELTSEIQEKTREAFVDYLADPLDEGDMILVMSDKPVEETHETAINYCNILRDLKNPNSRNKTSLHQRFNIERYNVEKLQAEIRNHLKTTKVQPVLDGIKVISDYLNGNNEVTATITSFGVLLTYLNQYMIFKQQTEELVVQIIKKVEEFTSDAQEIFGLLLKTDEPLTDEQIAKLLPTNITDRTLHIITPRLGELLKHKDLQDKFCNTDIITKDLDIHLLLPIYLDLADQGEQIYNFAVSLSYEAPISTINSAIRNLLSPKNKIRKCALDCLSVSSIQPDDVNHKLFCLIFMQGGTNPSAVELLKKLHLKRPRVDLIYRMYNDLFKLKNKDESLVEDVGRSFAVLMAKEDQEEFIKYLVNIFESNSITNVSDAEKQFQNDVRASVSFALLQFKPLTEECMNFIITTGLSDNNPVVIKNFSELIKFYIENFEEDERNLLYNKMYTILNLPPLDIESNIQLRLSLIELCLQIVLDDKDSIYDFVFMLISQNLRSNDERLKTTSCKAISSICKKYPEVVDFYLPQVVQILPKLTTKEKIESYSYAYSSFVHSLGITGLNTKQVFEFTHSLAISSDQSVREIFGFVVISLSSLFKGLLEPSLPKFLSDLFKLTGDSKQNVRESADSCLEVVTSNLTKACSERALPIAIKFASDDNSWKSQYKAINFINNLFKKGTKNMHRYIFDIVSSISLSVKSASTDVKKASSETFEYIKSLITNESVSKIFESLVESLISQSNVDNALEKLMHMNLDSKLDVDSLSLIVPVLINGCRTNSNETKLNSLKIITNLPQISVDGSLKVFSDQLVPSVYQLISDANPNTRALASSCLSKLIVKFNTSVYDNVMNQLINEMISKNSFSERQGCAMTIASLIKTRGVEELNKQLLDFIEKARNDKNIQVRECYVSLLGFLSHFFGAEEFSSCYDITIDAVLEACSDTNDVIRTVGLRSVSLIAKTFAQSKPDLIINPFNNCALKDNWRYRLCAVHFLKSFVSACLGTSEADDRGIRNIGELLTQIEKSLQPDICAQTLVTLFILCSDPVSTVKQEAMSVWRQIVPNTGGYLRKHVETYIDTVTLFVTSDREVVRTVGALSMKEFVHKVGGQSLISLVEKLEELIKIEDIDIEHGVLLCIHTLGEDMDYDIKLRSLQVIAPFMSSPYEIVRLESLGTFSDFKKSLGDVGTRTICSKLVDFVYSESQTKEDISDLKGLINSMDRTSLNQLVMKILQRPLNEQSSSIGGKIISISEDALDPIFSIFVERIFGICVEKCEGEEENVSLNMSENIINHCNKQHLKIFVQKLLTTLRSPQPEERYPSMSLLKSVIENHDYDKEIFESIIRGTIYVLDDPVDSLMNMSIETIKIVCDRAVEKRKEEELIDISFFLSDTLEQIGSSSQLHAFEYEYSFEYIYQFIIECLCSSSENSVLNTGKLLKCIIPQLKNRPKYTRNLMSKIIFASQITQNTDITQVLLEASRCLFKFCNDDRDLMINSFASTFIKLFKENNTTLQEFVSDTFCLYANKISTPDIVIKIFLMILKQQGKQISSIIIKSLIKIISNKNISQNICDSIIEVIGHSIHTGTIQMVKIKSELIAKALISAGEMSTLNFINDRGSFDINRDDMKISCITIMTEIVNSNKTNIIDIIFNEFMNLISKIDRERSKDVKMLYPKLIVSMIMVKNEICSDMMPHIINMIEKEDSEIRVETIQNIQSFASLDTDVFDKIQETVLKTLVNSYRTGDMAVKFASSNTLFVLFKLEELTQPQLQKLAEVVGDVERTNNDFNEIIKQSQSDRNNKKIRR